MKQKITAVTWHYLIITAGFWMAFCVFSAYAGIFLLEEEKAAGYSSLEMGLILAAGNISGALLLYQEVIGRGFGGQHFLTGFCEHLRNLMVSLDPQTLVLIDGGDSLRQRYGQQARQCGLAKLLGYLNTASDYEFRFREANNKNLFVEVCLMKLASSALPQT